MCTATNWTLDEFDRQPFPFVLELIDHWADDPPTNLLLQAAYKFRPRRRKKVKGNYENAQAAMDAGVLPNASNTVTREAALPPWVQDARKELRAKKVAELVKGKK